jgi:hypothetical protein
VHAQRFKKLSMKLSPRTATGAEAFTIDILYGLTQGRTQRTLDQDYARTEANLARPRASVVSVRRGIDNSDEFLKMIIFTLREPPAAIQAT